MKVKYQNRRVHPLHIFHKEKHQDLHDKHPHKHLRQYALVFLGILLLFAMMDYLNDSDRNQMLQTSMLNVSRVNEFGYQMKFAEENIIAKPGDKVFLQATLDPPGVDEENPVQVRFASTAKEPTLREANTPDAEMQPVHSILLTSSNNQDFQIVVDVPSGPQTPNSMVIIGECEQSCGKYPATATVTINIIKDLDIE